MTDRRWFVVGLLPEKSGTRFCLVVEASTATEAVVRAVFGRAPEHLDSISPMLEVSRAMAAAEWACWPCDDLESDAYLVRQRA